MSFFTIRRIDDLGRIVISKDIRTALRIEEGDPLEVNLVETQNGSEIRIKPYQNKTVIDTARKAVTAMAREIIGTNKSRALVLMDRVGAVYISNSSLSGTEVNASTRLLLQEVAAEKRKVVKTSVTYGNLHTFAYALRDQDDNVCGAIVLATENNIPADKLSAFTSCCVVLDSIIS